MKVIFTDVDGTLLDSESYSFGTARKALDRIHQQSIPLVLVTSKTRAEVEALRRQLQNHDPFVVENGGAVFMPRDYFPFPMPAAKRHGEYDVIEFGARYSRLVKALQRASKQSHCAVKGFHNMTAEEVSACCQLSLEQAALAKQRDYDEPFEIVDPSRKVELLDAIEKQEKRWTQGDRFYHILGNNDKATAVQLLSRFYRQSCPHLITIGLGDGLNDASFLELVDVPIIVRSPQSEGLKDRVPRGHVTHRPGSEGWNQAVLEMIPE